MGFELQSLYADECVCLIFSSVFSWWHFTVKYSFRDTFQLLKISISLFNLSGERELQPESWNSNEIKTTKMKLRVDRLSFLLVINNVPPGFSWEKDQNTVWWPQLTWRVGLCSQLNNLFSNVGHSAGDTWHLPTPVLELEWTFSASCDLGSSWLRQGAVT